MAPKKLRVVCVAIPFKPNGEGQGDSILMVTSRKYPDRWIVPKGGWEDERGESLYQAAAREAGEEAGITSTCTADLPCILETADSKTLYHVFPLPVESLDATWLEAHERKREWVSYEEAERRLLSWGEKKIELLEGLRKWKEWRGNGRGQ